MHIGPLGAPVSQAPLRQVFVPVAGHEAPIGSAPPTSLGGTQMFVVEPKARPQVYAGRPSEVKRIGHIDADVQVAVQPRPGMQRPLAHSLPVLVQGRSMSMQIGIPLPPATEQAKPAGHSAALEQ